MTRQQRLPVGVAAGTVVMVISFLRLAVDLSAGRMSWAQLTLFVLAAAAVLDLVRRRSRPAPTVTEANWARMKVGALLILVFFCLISLFLVAFGIAEAIGAHHYGWLLVVPLGLWGLRKQLPVFGKVWRADPSDLSRDG